MSPPRRFPSGRPGTVRITGTTRADVTNGTQRGAAMFEGPRNWVPAPDSSIGERAKREQYSRLMPELKAQLQTERFGLRRLEPMWFALQRGTRFGIFRVRTRRLGTIWLCKAGVGWRAVRHRRDARGRGFWTGSRYGWSQGGARRWAWRGTSGNR